MIRGFRQKFPTGWIADVIKKIAVTGRNQPWFTSVRIVEKRPVIRQWQIESKQVFGASRPALAYRVIGNMMATTSNASRNSRDCEIRRFQPVVQQCDTVASRSQRPKPGRVGFAGQCRLKSEILLPVC